MRITVERRLERQDAPVRRDWRLDFQHRRQLRRVHCFDWHVSLCGMHCSRYAQLRVSHFRHFHGVDNSSTETVLQPTAQTHELRTKRQHRMWSSAPRDSTESRDAEQESAQNLEQCSKRQHRITSCGRETAQNKEQFFKTQPRLVSCGPNTARNMEQSSKQQHIIRAVPESTDSRAVAQTQHRIRSSVPRDSTESEVLLETAQNQKTCS
ncbi:hypothetical protein NDU88_005366 [Pleurodeles waltl]|uniref:Uncharacterized protein n=1 Tax=Pleurodeles waltl TaxID=8319 RepID=A0AAV7LPC6_PLEWA|nr:hypothetical protein NDU88_005366 [Pleurodeles waltl]